MRYGNAIIKVNTAGGFYKRPFKSFIYSRILDFTFFFVSNQLTTYFAHFFGKEKNTDISTILYNTQLFIQIILAIPNNSAEETRMGMHGQGTGVGTKCG